MSIAADEWWDGCSYKCGICTEADPVPSKSDLRVHFRESHGGGSSAGRPFLLKDHRVLRESQWRCSLCEFTFMRERRAIEEHLDETHGMAIGDYTEETRKEEEVMEEASGADVAVSDSPILLSKLKQ